MLPVPTVMIKRLVGEVDPSIVSSEISQLTELDTSGGHQEQPTRFLDLKNILKNILFLR